MAVRRRSARRDGCRTDDRSTDEDRIVLRHIAPMAADRSDKARRVPWLLE
jgi:hypothetical protein